MNPPISYLSNLIDLQRLERISVRLINLRGHDEMLIHQLSLVFQTASNIHSLEISRCRRFADYQSTLRELAERIPTNIRHIHIDVTSLEEMKMIVEKISHLYSLTFRWCAWEQTTMFGEFQDWLEEKGIEYLSQVSSEKLYLWFGERSIEVDDLFVPNKRVRTVDDQTEEEFMEDWNRFSSVFDTFPVDLSPFRTGVSE